MKKLSINPDYFPQFDELHVISDLHLGGSEGFQIFNSGSQLKKFTDHLTTRDPGKKIALVINGDLVDFLAEEKSAVYFDPEGAVIKLERIINDASFSMVWEGFHSFVATKNRFLIITLGNHDLELALPWVRQRLLDILSKNDEAARGRITLAFDGTGFVCRVGKAKVLCVHGNEVDGWNLTNHEVIRRLGRDIQYGQPVNDWIPNAGTQLVIDVMNGLKRNYPFIDLLKPEMQAVIPTIFALDPRQQNKLGAIAGTAARLAWDKIKKATGFLGEKEEPMTTTGILQSEPLPSGAGDYYITTQHLMPESNRNYARTLLEATEKRYLAGEEPISLISKDLHGQTLGGFTALVMFLRGAERSEVLREALENLRKDRSFDIKQKDDAYTQLDQTASEDFDFVVSGHTHLERAIERENGKGMYYNSGTWVRLIRLKEEMLNDKERFKKIFQAFGRGKISDLDNHEESLVMRNLTVVNISAEGATTTGRLQHVNLDETGDILKNIDDSQFTFPQQ